jgi:hypothetical protein
MIKVIGLLRLCISNCSIRSMPDVHAAQADDSEAATNEDDSGENGAQPHRVALSAVGAHATIPSETFSAPARFHGVSLFPLRIADAAIHGRRVDPDTT